jgi:hypothetical protein
MSGPGYALLKGLLLGPPVTALHYVKGRKIAMPQGLQTADGTFLDRRTYEFAVGPPVMERRQFTNSHDSLSPDARDLAMAIDSYKLHHRRRFITYEEMLAVVKSLGYSK